MLLRLLILFLPPPPVAKLKTGRKLKFLKKTLTTSPQRRTPKLALVHSAVGTAHMSRIHSTCIGTEGLRWVREVEYKFLWGQEFVDSCMLSTAKSTVGDPSLWFGF